LSFELFPIAFDSIPVHRLLLLDAAMGSDAATSIAGSHALAVNVAPQELFQPVEIAQAMRAQPATAPAAPQLGRPSMGGGWVAGLQT
jgi:hypothetical protein